MPKKGARAKGLTVQERKFVEHYVLHHNAAEAYGVAYPKSRKHAAKYRSKKGAEMLRKGGIQGALGQRTEIVERIANTMFEINTKTVLQEIAAMAFANADDFFEWGSFEKPLFNKNGDPRINSDTGAHITATTPYVRIKPSADLTRVQKAAIVAAEETVSKTGDRVISVKLGNKLGALTKLGDHLRLFSAPADGGLPAGAIINGNVTVNNLTPKDVAGIDDKRDALKAFEAMRNRAITVEPSPTG